MKRQDQIRYLGGFEVTGHKPSLWFRVALAWGKVTLGERILILLVLACLFSIWFLFDVTH